MPEEVIFILDGGSDRTILDFTLFALTDGTVKFDYKDSRHKRVNIIA